MRAAAHSDHDGHGCCETERAGTRNDQHGHRRDQSVREARLRAEQEPAEKGQNRDGNHHRHKIRRHAIGEALHGRATALGFADELHDLREHGLVADALRFHDETAAGVKRPTADFVARCFIDRHGLARHHGFVHGAGPFTKDSIYRRTLARPNAQAVATPNLIQRHIFFGSIGREQMCLLRCKVKKLANRSARLPPPTQFQHLSQENQRGDHRSSFEINGSAAVHIPKRHRKELRKKGSHNAVHIRRARA